MNATILSSPLPIDPAVPGAYGILSLETPSDWEKLSGRPLTSEQRAVLEHGGVLVRDRDLMQGHHVELSEQQEDIPRLPAMPADFGEYWKKQVGALMLTDAAESQKIKGSSSQIILTGLSPQQVADLPKLAARLGIPPESIALPTHYGASTPTVFYLSLLAAVASAVALSIAISQAMRRDMRAIHVSFRLLGLDTRWSRNTLIWALTGTACIGLSLGVCAGVLPLAMYGVILGEGFIVAVDWPSLAAVAVGIGLGLSARAIAQRRGPS